MRSGPKIEWLAPNRFELRGSTYRLLMEDDGGVAQRVGDDLQILKDRRFMEGYVDLVPRFGGGRLVELGIKHGGSLAFLNDLFEPAGLAGFDIEATPPPALERYLDRRQMWHRVHPRYGIDQADVAAIRSHVDEVFGTEPLDLIIDDASHDTEPTRAAFECLFPRLRPGGAYIIEDWAWQYLLLRFVIESADDPMYESAETFDAATGNPRIGRPPAQMHKWRRWFVRMGRCPKVPAALREWRAQYASDEGPIDEDREQPLAVLVAELALASAMSPGLIESIHIRPEFTTVYRGSAEVDAGSFRLRDHYDDPFGFVS